MVTWSVRRFSWGLMRCTFVESLTLNFLQLTKKFTKWLMKSEPESRFEKGVDVKVCQLIYIYLE